MIMYDCFIVCVHNKHILMMSPTLVYEFHVPTRLVKIIIIIKLF